jgi:hypothetical protein
MDKNEKTKKIDLDKKIKSFEGNFYPDGKVYNEIVKLIEGGATMDIVYKYCQDKSMETPLTVKKAILVAIDTAVENEKKTGKQKYELFKLAEKIAANDTSLSMEDWTLVKEAVGSSYRPAVVGFIWDTIDPPKS